MLIGFAVGGHDPGNRNVMGLGTAQRNVSAAILITLTNFAGTMAVPYVLVAAILLPLMLISIARWLGKRSEAGRASRSAGYTACFLRKAKRQNLRMYTMTLNDLLSTIAGISGLLFVVTSMLAMSFSLSIQQMTQPLRIFAWLPWHCWQLRCGTSVGSCHHQADPSG